MNPVPPVAGTEPIDPHRVLPTTPLLTRYRELRRKSERRRLKYAETLLGEPSRFGAEFAETVERFARYRNAAEPFYRIAREVKVGEGFGRTPDVILRLEPLGIIEPRDSPDRRSLALGRRIVDVPARELSFEYVDRELLIHRTMSPARWEDQPDKRSARGGLRLDVLLAAAEERRPVVGELKTPGDMDPFFALFQALACAAHLATPSQYERMRHHSKRGRFPGIGEGPIQLDVYVLFVRPEEETRHRYQDGLRKATEDLAPRLLALDEVARSIRRIVAVDLDRSSAGKVTASIRHAIERSDVRTRNLGLDYSDMRYDSELRLAVAELPSGVRLWMDRALRSGWLLPSTPNSG